MVIHAAFDHHVDLDRREADTLRGGDAVQHGFDGHIRIAHAPEGCFAQSVQAGGDARQACILQRLGFLGQQHGIGGQGDFNGLAFPCVQPGERFDDPFDAAAQQRLAAGQADFLHTQLDKQSGQALDFFKAEQIGARQKGVILVEGFARHAIGATQVAAVGDRNAQVAHRSLQGVGDLPIAMRYARHGVVLYGAGLLRNTGWLRNNRCDRDNFECLSHGAY